MSIESDSQACHCRVPSALGWASHEAEREGENQSQMHGDEEGHGAFRERELGCQEAWHFIGEGFELCDRGLKQ